MNGVKELRKHERHRLRGQIGLSWATSGNKISALTGNCLDVSVYGMLIEVPAPIPIGTIVSAMLPASGTRGDAVVLHCRQYGPWFRIGLKFSGALLLEENVPHIHESLLT